MVDFIIVGTQRSGTTYIRRCLDSHSMIQCHGEVFEKRYRDPFGYYEYIDDSLPRRIKHLLLRGVAVNDYLDYLSSVSTAPIVGFKLMRSQFRRIPYRFPMLLDQIKAGDIKIIQVIRRNILKTYLSRLSAQVSGRYHAKSDSDVVKLTVNTSHIISELDIIHAENEWWQVMLSGTDFMVVEYENFVVNKDDESRRMLDYIGVERYEELSSANKKINPDDLSQMVLNFPELEAMLQGTRYEYCLQSDQ